MVFAFMPSTQGVTFREFDVDVVLSSVVPPLPQVDGKPWDHAWVLTTANSSGHGLLRLSERNLGTPRAACPLCGLHGNSW